MLGFDQRRHVRAARWPHPGERVRSCRGVSRVCRRGRSCSEASGRRGRARGRHRHRRGCSHPGLAAALLDEHGAPVRCRAAARRVPHRAGSVATRCSGAAPPRSSRGRARGPTTSAGGTRGAPAPRASWQLIVRAATAPSRAGPVEGSRVPKPLYDDTRLFPTCPRFPAWSCLQQGFPCLIRDWWGWGDGGETGGSGDAGQEKAVVRRRAATTSACRAGQVEDQRVEAGVDELADLVDDLRSCRR